MMTKKWPKSTHPVITPEGTSFVVCLEDWYWDAMHWMETKHGQSRNEAIQWAWEWADGQWTGWEWDDDYKDNIGYRFEAALEWIIHFLMRIYVMAKDNIANDDYVPRYPFCPEWLARLREKVKKYDGVVCSGSASVPVQRSVSLLAAIKNWMNDNLKTGGDNDVAFTMRRAALLLMKC